MWCAKKVSYILAGWEMRNAPVAVAARGMRGYDNQGFGILCMLTQLDKVCEISPIPQRPGYIIL